MKCLSCDVILSDFEATRKYAGSGQFVDLCNKCFKTIDSDVVTTERTDLFYEDGETYDDYDATDST